jgi:hypothetical protein
MPTLALNGLKPAAELAKGCGTRLQYHAGCRCYFCRTANSDYERERVAARKRGEWNGLVDASAAREHLLKLRKQGVGRRAVRLATDLNLSVIIKIYQGTRTKIRASTEKKILAVTPASRLDGAHVSAKQTWRRLDQLLDEGFTKERLAQELGFKSPKIAIGKNKCTVEMAGRVERLWNSYMR